MGENGRNIQPSIGNVQTMRAMVLSRYAPVETEPLRLADWPSPIPKRGEVRLRVQACGVCHTDLHLAEGEIRAGFLPIIPGHQVVGVVDVLGDGVSRFRVGERVGVPWLYSTCGGCEFCRRGEENLCEQARFTGRDVNGGFAEFMVAPAAYCHPIPEGLDAVHAAPLLCAGAIGLRSLKLCAIKPGGRLGLFGFGASAHIAIQIARFWDCKVYVFTRSEEHRRHAIELGAVWSGTAQDTPPDKLDAAITFAPVGSLVPVALGLLRKGGALAINAIHMTPIPEMPYDLLYGERVVRSVANLTRQDAAELLELAVHVPIRTEVETHPLEQANQAIQRLKGGLVRGAAVLRI